MASGVITTSQRIGFPLGLAILVTIASAFSFHPMGDTSNSIALIVLGFRYAFAAATIMSMIGLAIALTLKKDKPKQQQRLTTLSPLFILPFVSQLFSGSILRKE